MELSQQESKFQKKKNMNFEVPHEFSSHAPKISVVEYWPSNLCIFSTVITHAHIHDIFNIHATQIHLELEPPGVTGNVF